MASLAPSNYDKTCQLYWEVPKLIYYMTLLKGDKYFNWDNVPIQKFTLTTVKVGAYLK